MKHSVFYTHALGRQPKSKIMNAITTTMHARDGQAALPQGIVPFVFAREYSLHATILSTG